MPDNFPFFSGVCCKCTECVVMTQVQKDSILLSVCRCTGEFALPVTCMFYILYKIIRSTLTYLYQKSTLPVELCYNL